MHIVVLGAGLIGISTAYHLLRDGHRVTVVDQAEQAAAGTSFANGGLICPGHAYAWGSPRRLRTLLHSLYRPDQPVRLRLRADPAMAAWGLQFLAQCTHVRAAINTGNKSRLCRYSQEILQEVVDETGIDFHGNRGGLLYLHRTPDSLHRAAVEAELLIAAGQQLEIIDREEVLRIEPALAHGREPIEGAVYAPTDETGDACRFTRKLADWCAAKGAEMRFATRALRLCRERDRITRVETDGGDLKADAYVLALGVHTPQLARPVGLRVPIYPVKGYSITASILDPDRAPGLGGIDEHSLLVWSRLGDQLRITSRADIGVFDTRHRPKDFERMQRLTESLFPGAADFRGAGYWAGLRPMTPEGTPRLGPTPLGNLHLNAGHGHLGWTMACGSGKIVADLLAGRKAAIALDGLRYA
jgi:D-amino-acid dehydrogenase